MRTRTLPAATALAVLFSSAALVAGTAGPAAADSSKVLPVQSTGDIVVDGVHKKVFISDPTSGKIVATDYTGTVLGTVTGLPGVDGLALSPDSGQLYAAVTGDDRIVSVDTGTYKAASYALDGADAPADLEVVDGRIWFGYGANLGSLDISGTEPVVKLHQRSDVDSDGTLLLGADPAAPGVLVAGDGSQLAVFDVSAEGATLRTKGRMDSSVKQLDLTPDGTKVLTSWDSSGNGYALGAYSATDLTQAATRLPIGAYPNAVAIAADGTIAGGSDSSYDPDVHIFKPGSTKPVRQYDFPNTGNTSGADLLAPGALAWAPDGSRVFAVSSNSLGTYSLRVLTDPAKSLPTLTVTAPASATRAKALTVKGKLTASVPLPAGTPLTVTRTDLDSPSGKSLGTKTLGTGGAFSFTDTPPAGGKVTYKVSYAGSATHAAASGSASVNVSRATPALTLTRNLNVFLYGQDPKFLAHLGTTYKNRTVEIWADPYGADKPKKLLKRGTVNSNGDISAILDMTRDTVVTAVFTGDARYAPRTVKSTVYTKVNVSTTISRHYKTGKIGSTTYYYFHKKTNPLFNSAMTYYPGRSQRFAMEVYYAGKWHRIGEEYFRLGTDGRSLVELVGGRETGVRARMVSSYIDTTSGDNVNYTTHGAWKYFIFTA
ncbi:lactonase family protein [Streptomyces sp. GMY02]|uniref:lactonase family protein n=1 Tax=Streptomyces sp. GMY02 TaxID=1333528 RepID=UPI001C2BF2E6|nr:lactonase family protein [Streptomyces sp. GMY02]QXE35732.1 lactonase family protein [Streptomyces sp. GMY02]